MKLQTFTAGCLLLFTGGTTFAQSVKLEHDSSWYLAQKQCTIRVLQLANLTAEDTGPLFLSVYARPATGWDGVGSPGVLLSRAPIASLAPNATSSIEVTAKGRTPPAGEKYTALLVERQEGRRFVMLDYVVYTSTYAFPRGQSGGVGSDDFAIGYEDILVSGNISLTGERRRAEYFIERIQNRRESNITGTLRIAVYATAEPYDGSVAPAVIATRPLGRLAQGDFYNNVRGKLSLKKPGRGTFHLTLAIEEDNGAGFQPVAYVNVPEPRTF